MTMLRSTYNNYTYRSDGVKMREQSVHQYTKLVMKVSVSGDTTYVQRNASDTHYRAHYGSYVKETGQPDKIYNEEGYIALHGDSVSYHFFECDYLGSVRAVFDLYGNLEQTNDYNVTGIPSSRHTGNADVHKHTGKEYQGFNGLSWYDNQARYYDPILARFTTPDPLAEKYPWLSPYCHCANNPLRFVDRDGQRISYIEHGINFIYTYTDDGYGFYDAHGNPYSGNSEFVNKLTNALSEIQSVPEGQSVVSELMTSQHTFEIKEGANGFQATNNYYAQLKRKYPNITSKFGSGGIIYWDPANRVGGPDVTDSFNRDAYIGLAHELGHADAANKGVYNLERYAPNHKDKALQKITKDEYNAIKFENIIRKAKKINLRKAHSIDSNGSLFMPITF